MEPNILLKMERDKRGWTQKEVADQIKAGEASYHRWESQGGTPMPYYRQELARLFGKTIEELGLLPHQRRRSSPIGGLRKKSEMPSGAQAADKLGSIAHDVSFEHNGEAGETAQEEERPPVHWGKAPASMPLYGQDTLPDPSSSKGAPVPQESPEAQRESLDSHSARGSAQFPPLFASHMHVTTPLYIDEYIQDWNTWFVSGTLSPDSGVSDTTYSHNRTDSHESLIQTRRQMLYNLLMIGSATLVLSSHVFFDDNTYYNPAVVEELEHITMSYWRICANASLDVLENITAHFRTVVNLLQRSFPHHAVQRHYSLLGETAQLLGKTLFDLHEYTLAWSYYIFSLKAAQTASNHDLWAVGNGRIILLLIYWKMPQKAQSLLQEVRQLTIQSTRIACWLSAVEAEVCAHLDDADGCASALKAAKLLLESGPLDEDRYATGLNPSRLAGYEGACFIRLRQPERALPALKQALALLDPLAIRRQSTLFTDLGIAHAQQGKIKEACTFARQALAITIQTKSRAVLERVRTLCCELEPWKGTDGVKDLVKQLDRTVALITA